MIKYINALIKKYGITNSPYAGGYILPNGKMLDLSQTKSYDDIKSIDHDSILTAIPLEIIQSEVIKYLEKYYPNNIKYMSSGEIFNFMHNDRFEYYIFIKTLIDFNLIAFSCSESFSCNIFIVTRPTIKQIHTLEDLIMMEKSKIEYTEKMIEKDYNRGQIDLLSEDINYFYGN